MNQILMCKFVLLIFSSLWVKNNPKTFLLKDDEKDYQTLKERILATYSPKEILKQFNVMKRLINQCSIPNILKVTCYS